MAKITKRSAQIKTVLALVFLVIGILCWFVFSSSEYPRGQYFLSGGTVYSRSGESVRTVNSVTDTVTYEQGNIVIRNNYVYYFGMAITIISCIGLIINAVGIYVMAAKERS